MWLSKCEWEAPITVSNYPKKDRRKNNRRRREPAWWFRGRPCRKRLWSSWRGVCRRRKLPPTRREASARSPPTSRTAPTSRRLSNPPEPAPPSSSAAARASKTVAFGAARRLAKVWWRMAFRWEHGRGGEPAVRGTVNRMTGGPAGGREWQPFILFILWREKNENENENENVRLNLSERKGREREREKEREVWKCWNSWV